MKKNISGQSLFETLLAFALASIIIVGIVILATNSIKNSNFSKDKTTSSKYVQDAMEWLREEKIIDWQNLYAKAGLTQLTYCINSLNWPGSTGACSSGNFILGTPYKRQLLLVSNGTDTVEATVVVFWTDAGGYHEVRSATVLSDLR